MGTLIQHIERMGYDMSVRKAWDSNVAAWRSWYKGDVAKFHQYNVWNGLKKIKRVRLSMQMAHKCCEDWADLLVNERVTFELNDADSTTALNDILSDNDFWYLVNDGIEQTGATGTGALVVRIDNAMYKVITTTDEKGKEIEVRDETSGDFSQAYTTVEYVPYESIFPLSWEGNKITECAFASHKTILGKPHVVLVLHRMNAAGEYEITTQTFESSKANNNVQFKSEETFNTHSNKPWFAILRYAISNNALTDRAMPWGLPPFANAIDALKAIDTAFDTLNSELELGRRVRFIKEELANFGPDGVTKIFDADDSGTFIIPRDSNSGDSPMYHESAAAFRTDAITEALEANLAQYSNLVGFGKDFYHFKDVTDSGETATAVVSRNSALFRRKKKHETVIENALHDIIEAIIYASTVFGAHTIDPDGLTIGFDDSIIEDTDAKAKRKMQEVQNGLALPEEYRIDILNDSPEKAMRIISVIQGRESEGSISFDDMIEAATLDPSRMEAVGVSTKVVSSMP